MSNQTAARIAALQAKAFACVARVEAMRAFNAERIANGWTAGYDESAFHAEASDLDGIAKELQKIAESPDVQP